MSLLGSSHGYEWRSKSEFSMSQSATILNGNSPQAHDIKKTPRPRLFYLDLVRAIAVVLIFVTHFNNPALLAGPVVLAMTPFNIYIGDLGVSLFLIISGAALMVSHGDKLECKSFYWKRFKNIYPMFWLAWILATGFFILARGGFAANAGPPWSFVFTLLGIDGLVANFQIPTMYLLGEWFLGFIVVFYLVFPLLRWAVVEHPIVTSVIILALYAATLMYFDTPRAFPSSIILTTRLPELAFGMYLAHYWKRITPWALIPAVGTLALWEIAPPTSDPGIATTAVGISAFIVIVVLARFLDSQPVRALVGIIATYSYAIFLVHHVVIMQVFTGINPTGFTRTQVYAVFGATSLVIFGLSVALHKLDANVVRFVTEAFRGTKFGWRREVSDPVTGSFEATDAAQTTRQA